VSEKRIPAEREVVGFLGIGLDQNDGHQRVTSADHFFLVGGSEETHERMQTTAIQFNEALDRKGKSLGQTSAKEALDMLREALES